MNQDILPPTASAAPANIPCTSKQLSLRDKEMLYPHQQASLPIHPSSRDLCQRCQKFATIIDCHLPCSDKKPFLKNFFLEEIDGVSETTSKSCRLCKFWLRLHLPDQDHLQLSASYHWSLFTSKENRHLFCGHTLFYQKLEMFTLTVLQKPWDPSGKLPLNPTGKLIPFCDAQTPWFRPLNAERIGFKVPRKWLKECGDMHLQCSKGKRTRIPELKLIDCHTRKIVHDAMFDYVALSYIWGPQSTQPNESNTENHDEVLSPLPESIENAMEVTTELGFRYLWVDKYCILADDEDRHLQIGHMDEIYTQADLTLIALGHSPSHGLPGVRSRARHHQETIEIGGHTWIHVDRNPQEEIRNSKWSTRAWTYQEALLSKRRLFFTDRELYFECLNFFRSEAFDFPLSLLDLDDSVFSVGGEGIFPDRGVGDEAWQVLHRIGEYSKREMSFESDVLNGFLGLFRAFFPKGVRHCWGIPFSSKNEKDWPKRMFLDPPYRPISFAEGLSWESYGGAKRRKGFPSWSWAGWFGRVTWAAEILDYNGMVEEKPFELDVKLEIENGELVTLEEYTDDDSLYCSTKVIGYVHFSAFITPMTMEEILPEKWRTPRTATDKRKEPEKLWGIHLGTREDVEEGGDRETMVNYPLLIVRDFGEFMERVGIVYEFDEGIYNKKSWGSVRLG